MRRYLVIATALFLFAAPLAEAGVDLQIQKDTFYLGIQIARVALKSERCKAFFYANWLVDPIYALDKTGVAISYANKDLGEDEPETYNPKWIAYVNSTNNSRIILSRTWAEKASSMEVARTIVHELAHVVEFRQYSRVRRVWEEGYFTESACFNAPYRGPAIRPEE